MACSCKKQRGGARNVVKPRTNVTEAKKKSK